MDANRVAAALLVDDDPDSQQANQHRLEGDGYMVALARDQNDGLARAKQTAPNVIFIHLVSGEAGSMSIFQALRSEDACRHIRVVVLRNQPRADVARKKLRTVPRDGW